MISDVGDELDSPSASKRESKEDSRKRPAAARETHVDMTVGSVALQAATEPHSIHKDQLHRVIVSEALKRYKSSQNHQDYLSKMEKIIQEMPETEAGDYVNAVRRVPQLVQMESSPERYLEHSNFDPQAASRRLVAYWKHRVQLFGDRAFCPMAATSTGALSEREHEFIRAGVFVMLPNDKSGCPVFCIDNSRRLDHAAEPRARTVFYMSQIICENDLARSEGFMGITVLNDVPKHDMHTSSIGQKLISIFPVKVKSWHIVDLTPNGALDSFDRAYSPFLGNKPSTFHRYSRRKDYVSAFKLFGIQPYGLPRSMGGTWRYKQFVHWQNDRCRIERERHLTVEVASAKTSDEEGETHRETDQLVDFVKDHLRLLNLAMNQLPAADKERYLEALQHSSPEIWENESNLESFLLAEELNCWLAAKRVLRYWDLRASVFGDKKYLPLHQTGDGALGQNDITSLKTMFTMILPSDPSGSPVLWINTSRLEDSSDRWSIPRCLFYMCSLLTETAESQDTGANILFWLPEELDENFHSVLTFFGSLANSLPIQIKAIHVVSLRGKERADSKYILSLFQSFDEVYLHTCSTKDSLLSKLEQHGLVGSNLPKTIGGSWGIEKFFHWKEIRSRCEWNLPIGLSGRSEISEIENYPAIRPSSVLPDAEKKERKRRLKVIHCRRARDRIRVESEVLNEHIATLQQEKTRLQREVNRLEGLLESAKQFVLHGTTRARVREG